MARHDHGFTLTELAVVSAVLAVLIAIASGVFLGAKQKAQEVGAQATLREAIIAGALVLDANGGAVPPQAALSAELATVEPDITWKQPDTHADTGEVSTSAGIDHIMFASGSSAGDCHYARLELDGTFLKHRTPAAVCRAVDTSGISEWLGW